MELELRINGVIADQDVTPGEPLISLLRRQGYSSVKRGCETGECGACTVLVDGVPRPSCVMLAAQVGGCTLTTAESLGQPDRLHALQAAFAEVGAAPCGFCTSGMLLSAYALLQKNSSPTEEEVRNALSGNLCRCNGYAKPVQAVLRAAAVMRGEKPEPLKQQVMKAVIDESSNGHSESVGIAGDTGSQKRVRGFSRSGAGASQGSSSVTTKIPAITPNMVMNTPVMAASYIPLHVVGKPLPMLNANRTVTGKMKFVGDSYPPAMAYGRILTSPHAHAVIRSIDVSQAKALPGVLAVLTYKDIPRVPYSTVEHVPDEERILDRYSLDYIVRYVGDRVAAVVAESPEIAAQALKLISVDYDVQPAVFDQRNSLKPDSPCIHPERESKGIMDAARNIASRVRSEVGDVEQGFASSDYVIESEYLLPPAEQALLETRRVITYIDENGVLVVRTNSQIPQYIRRTLAKLLGLPLRRLKVEMPVVGGNFGTRQEMGDEDLCAWLTLVSNRPVLLERTREDEFTSGNIRQGYIIRLKSGVGRDGSIIAHQMVLLADTGAYGTHALTSPVHGASALALYPCANMRYVAEVLYTNHAPARAYQGYELSHEFFAMESHMDDIAKKLKMDALILRRKNWIKPGTRYPLANALGSNREANITIDSKALATCLRVVEENLGWSTKRGITHTDRYRRGVGIAISYHMDFAVYNGISGTMIKLNEDGSFDIFVSRSESGNGTFTQLSQIAAEALDVSVNDIIIHAHDTDSAPFETSVSDTLAFYNNCGAVKKAAEQIRRQILSIAGRMLNALPESLKIMNGTIRGTNGQQVTIAQVAAHSLYVENRQVMTTASWKTQVPPVTFAVQGVELEVDVETGSIRILKAVTAIDVGKPINPLLMEGQVEGQVAQALSMSMSEELVYDQKGKPLTTNYQDYHIYTASEMPEIQTYFVESTGVPEFFGAKAVASVPFYGIAPAIANAILDAADVRIRQLPFTPERILRALHAYITKQSA